MTALGNILLRCVPEFVRTQLRGRADLQSILQNSGWLLFDKFLRLFLGVFISAWMARYLGPAEFGELAYIIAFIAFFQVVATLGLDAIVVRDIASRPSSAGEILGTTFALRLVMGLVCWLVAVGSMVVLHGHADRTVLLSLLAGSVLIFQAADTVDLWFQSQSQNRKTVSVKLVSFGVSSAVKIFLIVCSAPLYAFAAVIALDVIAAAVGLVWVFRRSGVHQRWTFTWGRARNVLGESWPFIVSGLSVVTYMKIDQVMIKQMLGADQLGLYSAILPLSALWHVIPMTLCISLSPFVAKKKSDGEQVYYRVLLNIFRVFLVSSVAIACCVSLLAPVLIRLIYGEEYMAAAKALSIHVFTVIPVFLGVARSLWIVNERRPMLSLYSTIVGALVSVIINFLLIPRIGMVGAATAAVVSYFISAVLLTAVLDFRVFLMQIGIGSKGTM